MKIAVTGATGKLGHHVIDQLLQKVPAGQVVAAVRNPAKAADIAARGVEVRLADYSKPETLRSALQGVDQLLLISSSEVGQRATQHRAVIEAAKSAGVGLIVYTSILRADTSPLQLAAEHKETEELIRASGIPFVLLRNGWYVENYTENLAPALEHGAIVGSAGEGRIAAATRRDYAAAAVAVLTSQGHENHVYELGGDERFTMAELAAEVARAAKKPVVYKDLPPADYQAILVGAGLPEPFAAILVDADVGASRGALDDTSGDLHRLIGRKTTPVAEAVAAALR